MKSPLFKLRDTRDEPLSREEADSVFQFLAAQGDLGYVDLLGYCWIQAEILNHRLTDAGLMPFKAWAFGVEREGRIESYLMAVINDQIIGKWDYHVAPCFYVQETKGKAPQPYVFDPVLAKSAVSLDEWTKRLDCSPARATVTLSKQAPNTKSEDNDYNFGPWPRNEDQIERETKDHLRWTARPFEHPLNHGKAIELKSMKEIIDRFPARKKTAPKAASPSKAAIALKT